MTRVDIAPGICGLPTSLTAVSEDGQQVKLTIESECPFISALQEELGELDAYTVCFAPFSRSPVYQAAETHFQHAACPVPAAIIKAVEAEAGLALPKDVRFLIEK